ncbi:MAG: T9SS type A sorting domain-containing protein [Flavobacteriales bacterium]|nr:T9SS type A sorting domain-containing protein [Flavobacteriales bacterium]
MRKLFTLALIVSCLGVNAVTVNIYVYVYPTCNYPNGRLVATATGGVGPYTYLWSTGATTDMVEGVAPGTYTVTVTDFNNDQATDEITVTGQDYALQDIGISGPLGLCSNALTGVALFGPGPDGLGNFLGPLPYTVNGMVMQEDIVYDLGWPIDTMYTATWPASQFGVTEFYTFTDGLGCTGTLQDYVGYPVEWPQLDILDIQGACSGGNNGSITFQTGLEAHQQFTQVKLETTGGQYLNSVGAGDQVYTTTWTLPPGNYLLTQFMSMSSFLVSSGCQLSTPFTIPDLGTGCGTLSGTVFMDNSEDCVRQGDEPGVGGVVMEILPGPVYTITNAGQYSVNLPLGAYTVQQQSAVLEDHCLAAPAPFTLALGTPFQTVNVADTALVPMDAGVSLASGAARPGFQMALSARVVNNTLASTGASTLTITFDPMLSFVSANPVPNISGNTLTWNIAAFSSFQERTVHVQLQVPPDINLLGTDLTFDANFSTGNTDAVLANNTTVLTTTVTGSYDPNDKTARTSSGLSNDQYDIEADEWIDYTIRFQNTGTDTAFNIVITDTIPSELDLGTFQAGASSHAHSLSIRDGNVLRWAFYNIQLPDSNVNEPRSHGFVSFRIRPHLPIAPGTVIENIANIYFDFNPPVITEPSVLVAEFSTGIGEQLQDDIRLVPNPVNDELRIIADGSIQALRIMAADGREVIARSVRAANTSIAVDRLQAGAYLLIATFADGTEARERFIKN